MRTLIGNINTVHVKPLLNFSAEYSTNDEELDKNAKEMFRTIDHIKRNAGNAIF